MMTPLENLYYAIGELAYAVARADGEIQRVLEGRLNELEDCAGIAGRDPVPASGQYCE